MSPRTRGIVSSHAATFTAAGPQGSGGRDKRAPKLSSTPWSGPGQAEDTRGELLPHPREQQWRGALRVMFNTQVLGGHISREVPKPPHLHSNPKYFSNIQALRRPASLATRTSFPSPCTSSCLIQLALLSSPLSLTHSAKASAEPFSQRCFVKARRPSGSPARFRSEDAACCCQLHQFLHGRSTTTGGVWLEGKQAASAR